MPDPAAFPLSATSADPPAMDLLQGRDQAVPRADLERAIMRARKALALSRKVGEPAPGGGAPVAAGGAPDPGTLTTEAFAQGGALPPETGVPRRRKLRMRDGVPVEKDVEGVPMAVEIDAVPEPLMIVFQGLPVIIDRPAGFTQVRLAPDGSVAWTRTYTINYGYLPGTCGGDDDELDVFVGPDTSSSEVWWFTILDGAGAFDEYKLVLGARGREAAAAIIAAHIPPQFVGPAAVAELGHVKALVGVDPDARDIALVAIAKALDDASSRIDGEVAGATNEPGASTPTTTLEWPGSKTVKALEVGPEERYVLGIVLEPETTDLQGEVYSADVVRESAYGWLADYRNVDLGHKVFINRSIRVVESYIAPQDLTIGGEAVKAGTWLLGVIVEDPALWGSIKRGEYTGWSINGLSRKEPV